MKLYEHQQKVIKENPQKRLIAFGCGGGKTRTVLELAKGKGRILIVAPKTQVQDRTWEREAVKMGVALPMTVVSKEAFKKNKPACDVLVLDESHFAMGVLPSTKQVKRVKVPKTSQIYQDILEYIREVKPSYIYMASATPLPQPMALYAMATLFGAKWDYFKFREAFYVQVPRLGWDVWLPKKDKKSKDHLLKLAKQFGTFGRLEDFFDVPEQTHKTVDVGETAEQKKSLRELRLMYPDPLSQLGRRHQLEQGIFENEMVAQNKLDEVFELAKEFPKLLVFAKYTKQIDFLQFALQVKFPDRSIWVLDGRTNARGVLLRLAEESADCIVIAQSQVSTGYELPSFRCTVFASMSYSFVDYEQALGRTLRANRLAKNVYVYLLAGDVDKAVLKCVQGKRDFNERLFIEGQMS